MNFLISVSLFIISVKGITINTTSDGQTLDANYYGTKLTEEISKHDLTNETTKTYRNPDHYTHNILIQRSASKENNEKSDDQLILRELLDNLKRIEEILLSSQRPQVNGDTSGVTHSRFSDNTVSPRYRLNSSERYTSPREEVLSTARKELSTEQGSLNTPKYATVSHEVSRSHNIPIIRGETDKPIGEPIHHESSAEPNSLPHNERKFDQENEETKVQQNKETRNMNYATNTGNELHNPRDGNAQIAQYRESPLSFQTVKFADHKDQGTIQTSAPKSYNEEYNLEMKMGRTYEESTKEHGPMKISEMNIEVMSEKERLDREGDIDVADKNDIFKLAKSLLTSKCTEDARTAARRKSRADNTPTTEEVKTHSVLQQTPTAAPEKEAHKLRPHVSEKDVSSTKCPHTGGDEEEKEEDFRIAAIANQLFRGRISID